jgi:hypothetical protein
MEIVCPSCRYYRFDNRNIDPITLLIELQKQIPAFACTDCGTIFRPLDEAEEAEWQEMREILAKQKVQSRPLK